MCSTRLDDSGVHAGTVDREQWRSGLNPQVPAQSVIQPQYLSMRDLHRNMRYLESNGENTGVYVVAFWTRALYAPNVLVLVLVLCAMPFAFGTMRLGGLGKRISIGMLLAIAWYFLQKSMINFGTV